MTGKGVLTDQHSKSTLAFLASCQFWPQRGPAALQLCSSAALPSALVLTHARGKSGRVVPDQAAVHTKAAFQRHKVKAEVTVQSKTM